MGNERGASGTLPSLSSVQGKAILERVRIAMSKAAYTVLPPSRIRPMKGQPRVNFNPISIGRLAASIQVSGQITPGIIRKVPLDENGADHELCDGERRYRAVKLAEVGEYRAMCIEIDDIAARYVVSVTANFNRESHTTLEVLDSIVRMRDELRIDFPEIAQIIGFSLNYVSNFYGLRRLVPEVRDMLDPNLVEGKPLPVSAAIELSKVPAVHQLTLALRVMRKEIPLHSLGHEIGIVAQKHGLRLRTRTVEPSDRRKSMEQSVEVIRKATAKLSRTMTEEGGPYAMDGWPASKLEDLRTQLAISGQSLLTCVSSLESHIDKKRPRLIRG